MKTLRSIPVFILCTIGTASCGIFEAPFLRDTAAPAEKVAAPLQQRPRLEPISRNYFVLEDAGQMIVGTPQIVFSRKDDTFSDFAREYGLGYDELVDANPEIDPWLPGEGTAVLLPTQYLLPDVPKRGVVLNIASKRLFYFPAVAEGAKPVVMTFPIGIGRVGWETPLGQTKVVAKATDPTWYVPASVRKEHREAGDPLPAIVGPGPDNPLGRHVLQLGLPGYLIHGTNQPYGVGMRVSHGCVRLYPENIELLYSLIEIGEEVAIINEPFLVADDGADLYFEAHAPLEDDEVAATLRLQQIIDANKALASIEVANQAKALAAKGSGIPVRLRAFDSMEVYSRARVVRNTVEYDPDAPTLEEVRALLDAEDAADDDITPPATRPSNE